MKKIAVIALAFALMGCDTVTTETTTGYQMPTGLTGCRVFYLRSEKEQNLYVTRCPETTSTHWSVNHGKSTSHYDSTADNYGKNTETRDQAIERLNKELSEAYQRKD